MIPETPKPDGQDRSLKQAGLRFVSVWRITPDFRRLPAGRIVLDRASGSVTAEAADSTSRRLLEGFLVRGAVGFDLVRRFPSDGDKFIDAVNAELVFRSRERSGGVRSFGGRDSRWTRNAFPLSWVRPQQCAVSQAPRHRERPAPPPAGGLGENKRTDR